MKKIFFFITAWFLFMNFVPSISAEKEAVSYLTQPSSADEQAIANVLETMISSYNDRDIEKHLSCFSPDARIDSKLAGGFVTFDEYREILKKGRLPTIRLKNTKINKISENKFQVDTTLVGPKSSSYLIYAFVAIEGKWLVIEQRYK
jgi:hypothetical protein